MALVMALVRLIFEGIKFTPVWYVPAGPTFSPNAMTALISKKSNGISFDRYLGSSLLITVLPFSTSPVV
jgi:hypothetical protein